MIRDIYPVWSNGLSTIGYVGNKNAVTCAGDMVKYSDDDEYDIVPVGGNVVCSDGDTIITFTVQANRHGVYWQDGNGKWKQYSPPW